jgi:hypothetical protein
MPWHLRIHSIINNTLRAWGSARYRYYLHLPVRVGCTQQLNPAHPSYHHTLSPTADVCILPRCPLYSGSLQSVSRLLPRSHQLYSHGYYRYVSLIFDSCILASLPCELTSDKDPTDHTTTTTSGNLRSTLAITMLPCTRFAVAAQFTIPIVATLECRSGRVPHHVNNASLGTVSLLSLIITV